MRRLFMSLSILIFSLLIGSKCLASEDLGFLIPFQRTSSCLLATNGISSVQLLEGLRDKCGLLQNSDKGIFFSIKKSFFVHDESANGEFFSKRDVAFQRATSLARRELEAVLSANVGAAETIDEGNPGVVVVAQAEGWDAASKKYEVAVLSVGCRAIGQMFSDIRAGKQVEGPIGSKIEGCVKSYCGILCGSRLLFDEKGKAWFVGATSRLVAKDSPTDVIVRRNRGMVDLFSRKYAVCCLSGNAMRLNISGLRKMASGTDVNMMVEERHYYSVYGLSAVDLAMSYKLHRQESDCSKRDEKCTVTGRVLTNSHNRVEKTYSYVVEYDSQSINAVVSQAKVDAEKKQKAEQLTAEKAVEEKDVAERVTLKVEKGEVCDVVKTQCQITNCVSQLGKDSACEAITDITNTPVANAETEPQKIATTPVQLKDLTIQDIKDKMVKPRVTEKMGFRQIDVDSFGGIDPME